MVVYRWYDLGCRTVEVYWFCIGKALSFGIDWGRFAHAVSRMLAHLRSQHVKTQGAWAEELWRALEFKNNFLDLPRCVFISGVWLISKLEHPRQNICSLKMFAFLWSAGGEIQNPRHDVWCFAISTSCFTQAVGKAIAHLWNQHVKSPRARDQYRWYASDDIS